MRDPVSGNSMYPSGQMLRDSYAKTPAIVESCLDVEHGNLDARVLQMWKCDPNGNNANQEWIITKSEFTLSENPENPPHYPHVDRN